MGWDHAEPNTRAASHGHSWANQASNGPMQPLLLCHSPLSTRASKTLSSGGREGSCESPHSHEWTWAVRLWPLTETTHGPSRQGKEVGMDRIRPARDGRRTRNPAIRSFLSSISLGEGSLLCFDTSVTINVEDRGHGGRCSCLRARRGAAALSGSSDGWWQRQWACFAGNSWSGRAAPEPKVSRKPAFPVWCSQP